LKKIMSIELSRDFCHPETGQRFVVNGEEYFLGDELGNGAIGVVREARRTRDRALRAIKFLAPEPKYFEEGAFEDISRRFKREGERGSKLQYPHLITIYDYCANDEGLCFDTGKPKNPFILMERVRGGTLENYIRIRSAELKKIFAVTRFKLNIAIQVTNALSELHKKKLVHRDVKPANIFIDESDSKEKIPIVKLGDFGIVKWGDFQRSLTSGTLTVTNQKGLGTMKYMPLEQASSPGDVDIRSDIYSLGITFYELFTEQILPTLHHVYQVANARLTRGTSLSRFYALGYTIKPEDEVIAELILEMHLKPSGRPKIDKVRGILENIYENRYGTGWEDDVDW